jgi:hypothetical protein
MIQQLREENTMRRRNLLVIAGLAILTFTSCQAFASDDDVWTDYDPCGWNVEQEAQELEVAVVDEPWSDYDPCGWNVEEEMQDLEVAVVDEPWSDYDPCGWNVEQEGIESEVAKAFVADDKLAAYVN